MKKRTYSSLQFEEDVLIAHVSIESLGVLLTRCVVVDAFHRIEILGRVVDFRTVDGRHIEVL